MSRAAVHTYHLLASLLILTTSQRRTWQPARSSDLATDTVASIVSNTRIFTDTDAEVSEMLEYDKINSL